MGRIYNCNSILDYSYYFGISWISNIKAKVKNVPNSKTERTIFPCLLPTDSSYLHALTLFADCPDIVVERLWAYYDEDDLWATRIDDTATPAVAKMWASYSRTGERGEAAGVDTWTPDLLRAIAKQDNNTKALQMLGRVARMMLGPLGVPSDLPKFACLWTLLYHLPPQCCPACPWCR